MTKLGKGTRDGVGSERPTRELDKDAMTDLVRASGQDERKTRRFMTSQLRALGANIPEKRDASATSRTATVQLPTVPPPPTTPRVSQPYSLRLRKDSSKSPKLNSRR